MCISFLHCDHAVVISFFLDNNAKREKKKNAIDELENGKKKCCKSYQVRYSRCVNLFLDPSRVRVPRHYSAA